MAEANERHCEPHDLPPCGGGRCSLMESHGYEPDIDRITAAVDEATLAHLEAL